MRPTQSDVHVNRPLSDILVAFIQSEDKYINDKVFPVVSVQKKTDSYYSWGRDDFFRVEAAERAPGTPSEGGGMQVSTDTYDCKEYAIHQDVYDAVRDNADSQLDLDAAAARYVAQQLAMKREKVWTSTFFTTGIWTGTDTGVDQTGVAGVPTTNQFKQWNDAASTPVEDLRKQIVAMAEKTGYKPNKLVLGSHVWKALQDHPDLLDRIKFTQRGIVATELLAALLGLDQVIVGWAIENTAAQGATGAYSFMQGKSAALYYAAPAPALMAPSAGYTFAWTGRFGSGANGGRVKKFRIEERESDRIEGQMAFAQKVVSANLGAFFASAVA